MAAAMKSMALRCCWRQVSMMLSRVSTKRLPDSLCVPCDSLRQMTACLSERSARLLVGSRPG